MAALAMSLSSRREAPAGLGEAFLDRQGVVDWCRR
jgi:hypothetical protein